MVKTSFTPFLRLGSLGLPVAWCLAASCMWGQSPVGRSYGVSAASTLEHRVAVNQVIEGFNRLGSRAGRLREAMSTNDAAAFDAVMLDVMGALAALPGIELREQHVPDQIRPSSARPDRIPQLRPEAEGLVHFFDRLRTSATDDSNRKLFTNAKKAAAELAAALPGALPTVSARSLSPSLAHERK